MISDSIVTSDSVVVSPSVALRPFKRIPCFLVSNPDIFRYTVEQVN